MKAIDKFILHVVHNWKNKLNEAYIPTISFISKKSTFGISYDVYSNKISGADLRQNGFELTYSQKFGQLRKYRYRTVFD